jgi:hypothetical protein
VITEFAPVPLAGVHAVADTAGLDNPKDFIPVDAHYRHSDFPDIYATHVRADPVRPPRNISEMSAGRHWLWAKRFFANYYLWKIKRGVTHSPTWVW